MSMRIVNTPGAQKYARNRCPGTERVLSALSVNPMDGSGSGLRRISAGFGFAGFGFGFWFSPADLRIRIPEKFQV